MRPLRATPLPPRLGTWPMRALGAWLYELERVFRPRAPGFVLSYTGGGLEDPTEGALPSQLSRSERLVIALSPSDVLTQRFTVPLALYVRLHAALAIKVETAWPAAGAPPVWDATTERAGDTVRVALTMARADLAERALAAAMDLGAEPHRVILGVAGSEAPLALLPTGAATQAGGAVRSSIRAALLALYVAVAGVGAVLAGLDVLERTRSEAALTDARNAARPALEARAALTARAGLADGLRTEAERIGLPARLLSVVFAALPSSAVLTGAELRGSGISLTGTAEDPSALIARMNAVEGLRDARLSAPVVRDPRGGFRFDLEAARVDTKGPAL